MTTRDVIYVADYGYQLTDTAPAGVSGTVTWQAEAVQAGAAGIEAAASIAAGVFTVTITDGLVVAGHAGEYVQAWQVDDGAGEVKTYTGRRLTIKPDPTENGAGVVVPLDPTVGDRLTALESIGALELIDGGTP